MSNAPKPGPPAKAAQPIVTTDDTAALTGAPVKAASKPAKHIVKRQPRIVVSQGAWDDLARLRKVTDAGTGYELRADDDGTVTAYDRRTGQPTEDVEVVCPPVPAVEVEDDGEDA